MAWCRPPSTWQFIFLMNPHLFPWPYSRYLHRQMIVATNLTPKPAFRPLSTSCLFTAVKIHKQKQNANTPPAQGPHDTEAMLLLVLVFRPALHSKSHMSNEFPRLSRLIVTAKQWKWRLKFLPEHSFFSAGGFYPNYLNAYCLSFSICKSLTCLFAILGLKTPCNIWVMF